MDSGIVQSNWRPKEEKNLKDCVQWCLGGQSCDVEDAIQAENCVMLEPTDDGASGMFASPACQLLLTCPTNLEMQNISILSEARIVEVYGHHGEYLKTCRSELVEEVDDMAVLRTEIVFERSLTMCSLKFTSLKSKESMWLYGLRVILQPIVLSPINSRVPIHNVEQRLETMNSKLSEKAEAFKKLVDNYQSSPNFGSDYSSLAPMFQMLNMLNITNKPLSDKESLRDINTTTTNSIPSSRSSEQGGKRHNFEQTKSSRLGEDDFNDNLSNNNTDKISDKNMNLQSDDILDNSKHKQDVNGLEQEHPFNDQFIRFQENNLETIEKLEDKLCKHIDEQLKELEKKLWEKVERQMKELEQKLICKLDEILVFIKPQGVAR